MDGRPPRYGREDLRPVLRLRWSYRYEMRHSGTDWLPGARVRGMVPNSGEERPLRVCGDLPEVVLRITALVSAVGTIAVSQSQ